MNLISTFLAILKQDESEILYIPLVPGFDSDASRDDVIAELCALLDNTQGVVPYKAWGDLTLYDMPSTAQRRIGELLAEYEGKLRIYLEPYAAIHQDQLRGSISPLEMNRWCIAQ